MKIYSLPLIRIPLFVSVLFLYCYNVQSQEGTSPIGKYIAIGSSLSAGVQDGGLSADRQQTAFPNLLAKQLGQKDFRSPSIESTGRLSVKGNREHGVSFSWAEPQRKDLSFKKVTESIDNYAIPYQKVLGMALNFEQTEGWPDQFGKESFIYLNSFLSENEKVSYQKLIESLSSKEVTFFSYELGIEDFLEHLRSGGYLTNLQFLQYDREGYYPEDHVISGLVRGGAKGVILNLPQIYELPFFNIGTIADLRPVIGDVLYTEKFSKAAVRDIKDFEILIPGSLSYNNILLNRDGKLGFDQQHPLKDEDVITREELVSVTTYNKWLARIAKHNDIPIVDLYKLYKKINSGSYYSFDGVLINPTYPGGNFYSSDGIYPTALGQAVIANEVIQTLNSHYGLQIPNISISDFNDK